MGAVQDSYSRKKKHISYDEKIISNRPTNVPQGEVPAVKSPSQLYANENSCPQRSFFEDWEWRASATQVEISHFIPFIRICQFFILSTRIRMICPLFSKTRLCKPTISRRSQDGTTNSNWRAHETITTYPSQIIIEARTQDFISKAKTLALKLRQYVHDLGAVVGVFSLCSLVSTLRSQQRGKLGKPQ